MYIIVIYVIFVIIPVNFIRELLSIKMEMHTLYQKLFLVSGALILDWCMKGESSCQGTSGTEASCTSMW